MTFVSAWTQAPLTVVYKDSEGQEWIRKGGSRSWRNCNPGNISKGTFADTCGAIGGDTRFAIFPDETTGSDAIVSLMKSAAYRSLSIQQAIFQYAPPNENDSTAYVAAIAAAVGVQPSTVVGTLSANQFQMLAAGIKKHEGWQIGQEYAQTPGGLPQAAGVLAQMAAAPAQTVTIHPASPAGYRYEIRFDKTGANQGSIELKSWNSGVDWRSTGPNQDRTVTLTDITVISDDVQIQIACDGQVSGQTPKLTCSIMPAQGDIGAGITIDIRGTLFGWFDGTKTYPISSEDYQSLKRFVASAAFPYAQAVSMADGAVDDDPGAPAEGEISEVADLFSARMLANLGWSSDGDDAQAARKPLFAAQAAPQIAIDINKALAFLQACETSNPRVTYGLGAKVPSLGAVPGRDFKKVDCSGFVREAIRRSTQPTAAFPDGSVVQHEWVRSRGYEHGAIADGAKTDKSIRIAFLSPQDSPEGIGHVVLIYQGKTLESHGHFGPDSRPWTGAGWQSKADVFVLTRAAAATADLKPPGGLLTFAFDKGQLPTIACVNSATIPLGVDWTALITALDDYVNKYFSPVWGTPARVVDAGAGPVPPGCWGLVFKDNSDQPNALGYHNLTDDGLPLSQVFVRDILAAGDKVSVTASHEIAEMLIDPAIALGAQGPDGSTWYAYETADAVEREEFDVNGIAMSNFLFPAWFEGFRAPRSTQFDYLNHCTQPFELRPGGYISIYKNGTWQQIFGSSQAEQFFDLQGHPRASVRGLVARQADRAEAAQGISSSGVPAPGLYQPDPPDPHAPPGQTIYANIDLQIQNRARQTAIFVPDGFLKGPDIDIVLYLHGFQQNDDVSINKYLQEDYGKLREGVNASGRNVILVAPTLGSLAQANGLTQAGGLDGFLGRCLSALRAHGGSGWPDTLTLHNLIIAGHSGGGVPEREIAGGGDRALASLGECWGYESLYHSPDVTFWPTWARAHHDSRLRLFYRPHNSEENAQMVQRFKSVGGLGIANILVTQSDAPSHMMVPLTHWQACLRAAPFLEDRPQRMARSEADLIATSRAPEMIFAAAASPRPGDVIPIPPTKSFNQGLSSASEATMLHLLGVPGQKTTDCSPTSAELRKRISSGVDVGPFKVTGLKIAVDLLKKVFDEAQEMIPNVVAAVKNDGMLCVRLKRHSNTSFSNHSWGTAIDLFFGDAAVPMGENKTARGCQQLAPFFNKHGWYWGAGFSGSSVDSMHFELAEETIKAALGGG
jgi:D-alanyl-D-alanine carboxypeptidase